MPKYNSEKTQGIKTDVSRRTFLKLLGSVFTASAAFVLTEKYPFIKKFYSENRELITGNVDLRNVADVVPPQLEGVDIPTVNEAFRPMDEIIGGGLSIYEAWRLENTALPKLFYQKPENYLGFRETLDGIAGQLPGIGVTMREHPNDWYMQMMLEVIGDVNQPYSMIINGSTDGVRDIGQMITIDPGSGLVKHLRDQMKVRWGSDYEVWSGCRDNTLDVEQKEFVKIFYRDWYLGAERYVEGEVAKDGEPVSTNVLFAYFLFRNEGDILSSVWDTMLWLKITARNDVEDLKFNPNYDKALKVCTLFKDEFSQKINANWVVATVDPHDRILNNTQAREYNHYKNYMPPNRAGLYHPWNIAGLGLNADPSIAKRAVADHVGPLGNVESEELSLEYGTERTVGDLLVADRLDEVRHILARYEI